MEINMFQKLAFIEEKYEELSNRISDPEIISDINTWRKLMKEHSDMTPIVEKYREYKAVTENLNEAEEMLREGQEAEFEEMLKDEISQAKAKLPLIEEELKILLIPKDPNDDKSVIVEIRGGTGGEEAALFAGELFRMYSMYAEKKRWKIEIMNSNPTELGGFKEISFSVDGEGAYSRFKYESGVHRVQRVPETESQGRIQTSAASVAVLPEVEEVELEINQNDLKIDVFRAGGPGGQCVNTTDSAVRITHLPTGLVVSCQDEKSQHKNKDKALKVLRSRLYELMEAERNASIAAERKSQVGSGDRSERIRTYNFPQGRVTDHRINLTLYKIDAIMNGEIDELIDQLATYYQSEKLKGEI